MRIVFVTQAADPAHPVLAAELVDEHWVSRTAYVPEEERRPACLHDTIDDLGQLKVRIHFRFSQTGKILHTRCGPLGRCAA